MPFLPSNRRDLKKVRKLKQAAKQAAKLDAAAGAADEHATAMDVDDLAGEVDTAAMAAYGLPTSFAPKPKRKKRAVLPGTGQRLGRQPAAEPEDTGADEQHDDSAVVPSHTDPDWQAYWAGCQEQVAADFWAAKDLEPHVSAFELVHGADGVSGSAKLEHVWEAFYSESYARYFAFFWHWRRVQDSLGADSHSDDDDDDGNTAAALTLPPAQPAAAPGPIEINGYSVPDLKYWSQVIE